MSLVRRFAFLVSDARNFQSDEVGFVSGNVNVPITQHPHWLDGIPVIKQVHDFGLALKKVMPWIRFGVDTKGDSYISCSITWVPSASHHAYQEVLVYHPGHRYVYGRIGHKDYGIKETCIGYGVMSRKIVNKKIKSDAERKHMGVSTDMDRAVKTAVKNFVPYSLHEAALVSYEWFRAKVMGTIQEAVNDADKFVRRCADSKVLTAELVNLIKQNATFVTPEFKEAAAHFIAAQNEAQVTRTRNVGAYHITLSTSNDVQYAHVAELASDVKTSVLPKLADANGVTLKVEDLPDYIQAKLAVLMSVDDESYMPEIGYKEDAGSFWVEKTEGTNA